MAFVFCLRLKNQKLIKLSQVYFRMISKFYCWIF